MTQLGERNFDDLIAGSAVETVAGGATIATTDTGVRGQVMGRITASGKWTKYKSGSADGSEIPRGIAAEDYDASAADTKTVIYRTGEFNSRALVFDGADTLDIATQNLLQEVNIHTKTSIDTDGVHN